MGRISKQKKLIIEQANKRLLNESFIDIDNVLDLMKYKFGWGDLSVNVVEEFNQWLGEVKSNMTNEEYSTLFNEWLSTEYKDNEYNEI